MDDMLDYLILGLILLPVAIVIGVLIFIIEHPNEISAFIAGTAKGIKTFNNFAVQRLTRRIMA
jgi:uncharacterized membrane protein